MVPGRGSGEGGEKWLEMTGSDGGGNAQVVERWWEEGKKNAWWGRSGRKEEKIREERRGRERAGR